MIRFLFYVFIHVFFSKIGITEADEVMRSAKTEILEKFVIDMWDKHPEIFLVIELSVTEEMGLFVPMINPYTNRKVSIQGGQTNDWALSV